MALAILLFALALIAAGGGGIMYLKDRPRPAMILGGAGAFLLLLAIVFFISRPSYADAEAAEPKAAAPANAPAAPTRFAGHNVCRLLPDRSRVTITTANEVTLEWTETGCVNQRTQYAQNGDVWTRILVPTDEPNVAVLEFRPATGEYVVTRYALDAQAMTRVRGLRRGVDIKACTADNEARTVLADQQREISAVLPRLPNERLVYACENQRGRASAGP